MKYDNPLTGSDPFEMETEIHHTAFKSNHYQVSCRMYGNGQARNNSFFTNADTSAVLVESNMYIFQDVSRVKNNVLFSCIHTNNAKFFDNFNDTQNSSVVERPPPVLKIKLFDFSNGIYYTNDQISKVYLEIVFKPMISKEEKLGGGNLNRFVGTGAYPSHV